MSLRFIKLLGMRRYFYERIVIFFLFGAFFILLNSYFGSFTQFQYFKSEQTEIYSGDSIFIYKNQLRPRLMDEPMSNKSVKLIESSDIPANLHQTLYDVTYFNSKQKHLLYNIFHENNLFLADVSILRMITSYKNETDIKTKIKLLEMIKLSFHNEHGNDNDRNTITFGIYHESVKDFLKVILN
jgi:hypothetical protein